MEKLVRIWLLVAISILSNVVMAEAALIKYEITGHIETANGYYSDRVPIGSSTSGWMILDTDSFVAGGIATKDMWGDPHPEGLPWGLIDYSFDNFGPWGMQAGKIFFPGFEYAVWGSTLYDLPEFGAPIIPNGMFKLNSNNKTFEIIVYEICSGKTTFGGTIDSFNVTPVPVPGAALLLGSALLGLAGLRRKKPAVA